MIHCEPWQIQHRTMHVLRLGIYSYVLLDANNRIDVVNGVCMVARCDLLLLMQLGLHMRLARRA